MQEITRARRDALRGARLVVLSRYMRRELALAGLPGAVVVPPWVELGPERAPLVGHGYLFAGRLVAHKAPDLAWQAWRQSGVDAPLRVAGAGRLAASLEGAEALGWLEPEPLREVMRASKALLMPARWQEPFGLVVLEALAQSLPVLAMDVGGLSEWRGPGVRMVPAGDVGALAEAIVQTERRVTTTTAQGHLARRRAEREFRREYLFPRLWSVYVAAKRGLSSGRWSSA